MCGRRYGGEILCVVGYVDDVVGDMIFHWWSSESTVHEGREEGCTHELCGASALCARDIARRALELRDCRRMHRVNNQYTIHNSRYSLSMSFASISMGCGPLARIAVTSRSLVAFPVTNAVDVIVSVDQFNSCIRALVRSITQTYSAWRAS